MREITASEKTSLSLTGKFGEESRRWLGENAGYVAKHMWIVKHYGKASKCSFDSNHAAKRFEWANISGNYLRDMSDYIELCPSCHRKYDAEKTAIERGDGKPVCKHGHDFSKENTYIDSRGFRQCKTCRLKALKRWRLKNAAN